MLARALEKISLFERYFFLFNRSFINPKTAKAAIAWKIYCPNLRQTEGNEITPNTFNISLFLLPKKSNKPESILSIEELKPMNGAALNEKIYQANDRDKSKRKLATPSLSTFLFIIDVNNKKQRI